jgi:2-oxoglutarate dehydrogenase E1 component
VQWGCGDARACTSVCCRACFMPACTRATSRGAGASSHACARAIGRHRGHFAANLDPLRGSSHKKLNPHEPIYWVNTDAVDVCQLLKDYPHSVDLSVFGLEGVDRTRFYDLSSEFLVQKKKWWTVLEVVDFLRERYCGSIAVEYTHLSDRFQRSWLKTIFEGGNANSGQPSAAQARGHFEAITSEEHREALEMLVRADHLERFLGSKFPAAKRFGIEGAEAVLPGLHCMIKRAASLGVEGVEIGMAHRGRLNVLVNLFGKPLGAICNEFTESDMSVGDVKYHLGTHATRVLHGKTVHMNLAANPSHLEAVNAVVVGKARAKQYFIGSATEPGHRRVLPILVHGDAAFSGQGIVAEVMQLADIPSYTTGGTIHVVINNMIGFTTDPRASRSSYHCTNVAKGVEVCMYMYVALFVP